jgi:inner membrane transporter RhtA
VYLVISALFHYLGPSFAVLLFARVQVLGVAWLRIASAALIFGVWRRPWRRWRGLDARTKWLIAAWGLVLAAMNCCFYEAIARLPLGTVAAVEFLPVVGLAALGLRTARNGAALMLAVAGVYLLSDVQLQAQPVGIALAFANAILFATYIALAHRLANDGRLRGIDALAAAMGIAGLVVTPFAAAQVAPAISDPVALLAGVGVGVCSSVIPYVTDQLAMERVTRAAYSLMVSLLPATATVVGLVVLAQVPTAVDVAGVTLVVAGVALHRDARPARARRARPAGPGPPGPAARADLPRTSPLRRHRPRRRRAPAPPTSGRSARFQTRDQATVFRARFRPGPARRRSGPRCTRSRRW